MISDNNRRALIYHIMKGLEKNNVRAFSSSSDDLLYDRSADGVIRMIETRIYIGLNDAETKEQKYDTEKYLGILKKVCQSYHVAFSVDIEDGGYFHEDGTYVEETSFVLLMIGTDREVVRKIAKDLCAFFNQEAVLITENQLDGYFVSEELPV